MKVSRSKVEHDGTTDKCRKTVSAEHFSPMKIVIMRACGGNRYSCLITIHEKNSFNHLSAHNFNVKCVIISSAFIID